MQVFWNMMINTVPVFNEGMFDTPPKWWNPDDYSEFIIDNAGRQRRNAMRDPFQDPNDFFNNLVQRIVSSDLGAFQPDVFDSK